MSGRAASDFFSGMQQCGGCLLMSWARIDDAFDDHAKVLALLEHEQGCAAIGLWTLCLTYAHRNTLRKGKTPGLIAASLPRRYVGPTGRELAALLVKEGLWEARDDGDGWMIHDFSQYLPTAKTSAARAEAGRRGAASRWGKKTGRGNQSKPDSKLPSGQDNLPGLGHEGDGNAMASDGSRAPAHRAIPKGIAPGPGPVQKPPTEVPADDSASALSVTQRSKRLTDAYHEAEPMCKWPAVNNAVIRAIQRGKWTDDEILAGLLRMAAENRSVTVDALRIELGGLPSQKRPSAGRPSTTDQRVADIQALKNPGSQQAPGRTIQGKVEH